MIQVSSLRKAFGGPPILFDVSFSCPGGSSTALRGCSGSGKTTLLRLLAGLDRPDGGSIRLAGREAEGPGVHLPPGARKIGMVFQEPALWSHMTVEENIRFVLTGRTRREAAERVAEMLDLAGAKPLRTRRPRQLSVGQRQRAALARALAPEPAILLLDEPFSGLDNDSRRRLTEGLSREAARNGTTILLASHDESGARVLCERELILREGRLASRERAPSGTRKP